MLQRLEMTLYFDHNATAPIRPDVIQKMADVMGAVGNASSIHSAGRAARAHIETARNQVAGLVHAAAAQVIFNSGATEGNNTVIRGFTSGRILVGTTEHPSVLEPARAAGAEIIPVLPDGTLDLDALDRMIAAGPAPALISVMAVNNETGVIHPVEKVAARARDCGAAFHVDAVQAAGKIPVDMTAIGADYLTLSAHKLGGPQGVGALIIADSALSCRPVPVLLHGGGQERRVRAGTENVAGIAGFGVAAQAAGSVDFNTQNQRLAACRDRIENIMLASYPDAVIHGAAAPRVAGTTCLSLPGLSSETIVMNLDLAGVCISAGSACSSGTMKPSAVLRAMGVPEDLARCSVRFSIGPDLTDADMDEFEKIWSGMVKRVGVTS